MSLVISDLILFLPMEEERLYTECHTENDCPTFVREQVLHKFFVLPLFQDKFLLLAFFSLVENFNMIYH